MKMPEPIAYEYGNSVWYETDPRITDHIKKHGKPLYDKQALIDLLEAAAVECEDTEIVDGKGYYMQGGDAVATQRNIAAALRSMKEML